jgi:hypothetical protein
MTSQPTPLTGFKDLDRVIEEIHNPQTAKALDDAQADVTALDELRRKLCALPLVPQKSKWRFW